MRRSTRIHRRPVRYSPSITSLDGDYSENSVEEGELSEIQSGYDNNDDNSDNDTDSDYVPLTQELLSPYSDSSVYSEIDEIDEEIDEECDEIDEIDGDEDESSYSASDFGGDNLHGSV